MPRGLGWHLKKTLVNRVVRSAAPGAGDYRYEVGTEWVLADGSAVYKLQSVSGTTATWSDGVANSYTALAITDLSDSSTPSVLTVAETTGKMISNYQSSGADHVFTMPAPHVSGNVAFTIGDEFQIDIEPNSGDLFYLNGIALSVDGHIVNLADTLDEEIFGVCKNINGTLRWSFKSDSDNFVEATP